MINFKYCDRNHLARPSGNIENNNQKVKPFD